MNSNALRIKTRPTHNLFISNRDESTGIRKYMAIIRNCEIDSISMYMAGNGPPGFVFRATQYSDRDISTSPEEIVAGFADFVGADIRTPAMAAMLHAVRKSCDAEPNDFFTIDAFRTGSRKPFSVGSSSFAATFPCQKNSTPASCLAKILHAASDHNKALRVAGTVESSKAILIGADDVSDALAHEMMRYDAVAPMSGLRMVSFPSGNSHYGTRFPVSDDVTSMEVSAPIPM